MKVLCVFGTRPEAIKFASVIQALSNDGYFSLIICTTSQHRHMLDQILEVFNIKPDIDLNIMQPEQDLFDVTIQSIKGLSKILKDVNPDLVLVQGDTTTAFATALSAYYSRVKIAHIEAGLRTQHKNSPYPEELNRRAIAVFADAHFAPTVWARDNLIRENIPQDHIWVTGNTTIDALYFIISRLNKDTLLMEKMKKRFSFLISDRKLILVTGHRRESFGAAFEEICNALKDIAVMRQDVQIIYPVHLNPNVRKSVEKILGSIISIDNKEGIDMRRLQPNLFLIEPLDYSSFVYLLTRSFLVLTDSGGIQEEAPAIGKPVLIMRDVTERPEGIEAGVARLVGTSRKTIIQNVLKLLNDPLEYKRMAKPTDIYGDGHAAEKIVAALRTISL